MSMMSEMTLPSRHRIRNSNRGGLRLSTLPLGHGVLRVGGEETFLTETGKRTPNSSVEGSGANHYPRAPALNLYEWTEKKHYSSWKPGYRSVG